MFGDKRRRKAAEAQQKATRERRQKNTAPSKKNYLVRNAKQAYVNGRDFEEALKKQLNLRKNNSYSPDLAGYDEKEGRAVLVEAKYSSKGKGAIVYLEQLGRIEKEAKTQKDIYGKPPKVYYAFGFDNNVYLVPVEKLNKLANEDGRKITLWDFSTRGKFFLNSLKRVKSPSFTNDLKAEEEKWIKERYGKQYVRLREDEIKKISEKEFQIMNPKPVKKRKNKTQLDLDSF